MNRDDERCHAVTANHMRCKLAASDEYKVAWFSIAFCTPKHRKVPLCRSHADKMKRDGRLMLFSEVGI